jgi:hypothetical protein
VLCLCSATVLAHTSALGVLLGGSTAHCTHLVCPVHDAAGASSSDLVLLRLPMIGYLSFNAANLSLDVQSGHIHDLC